MCMLRFEFSTIKRNNNKLRGFSGFFIEKKTRNVMRINVEWQSIKKTYAAADVNRRVCYQVPESFTYVCTFYLFFIFTNIRSQTHTYGLRGTKVR